MRRLPVDEYLVLHITAAADQLLEHLAAIEGTALPDQALSQFSRVPGRSSS